MLPIVFTGILAFTIAVVLTYFFQKAYTVPRKEIEVARERVQALENEVSSQQMQLNTKNEALEKSEKENALLKEEAIHNQSSIASLSANYKSKTDTAEEYRQKIIDQESKLETARTIYTEQKAENSKYQSEYLSIKEKLDTQKQEIDSLREKSLQAFENIANKIFEEKTISFSKTSKENLDQLLNPLKENIKEFKKQVEQSYITESVERKSLESKIKDLVELNQQISKDATNLTKALKGEAKTQGDWGEMILENILEHSGLVKNREYFTQESNINEIGKRKQPDVIIKYPNDRHIIVDSKVSLTAYERFANCDDAEEQKTYLKEHIKSIRSHIDNLSGKEYDNIEKSLDFVMLFVPIEPAYMTAIHYEQELWSYAYKKRVLLISPTNLIAALKMVADIWKREHQNNNAVEIAKRGEALYDKFASFIADMEGIESALDSASKKYTDAFNKLSSGRGNLIGQAEKLKSMGLNPKKALSEKYLQNNEDVNKDQLDFNE